MSDWRVELTAQAKNDTQDAIECLIEASKDIFKASEADFQEMKERKWYKRLWKIVTFSKDNEKKMARGVSNLAKLQEIVMKALLILSDKSREISDILCEHETLINRLSGNVESMAKTQVAMLNKIRQLSTGIEKQITFGDLDSQEKIIFVNALASVAFESRNEDSKKYIRPYLNAVGNTLQDDINLEDCVEDLKKDRSELLYKMLMEYIYVTTGAFDHECDILDYIAVPTKKKTAICDNIQKVANLAGTEAFFADEEEDCFIVDVNDFEWYEAENAEAESDFSAEDYDDETDDFDQEVGAFGADSFEEFSFPYKFCVAPGETYEITDKRVSINSTVTCEGTMILENCVIVYNDGSGDGDIDLKPESELVARNCTFICKGYNKDKPFINSEKAELSFESCVFEDCGYFAYVIQKSNLIMVSSRILNCANKFLDSCDSKMKISGNIVENNVFADFNRAESTTLICGSYYSYADFSNNVIKEAQDFRGEKCEKQEGKNRLFRMGYGSSTRLNYSYLCYCDVSDCTFEGVSACFSWNNNIHRCHFIRCSDIVSGDECVAEGCVFEECTEVFGGTEKSKAEDCEFINCNGTLIDCGYSYCGLSILRCEFVNCTLADEESLIVLSRGKESDSPKNIVSGCVFDGISVDEGFIIEAKISGKPCGEVASVSDCKFSHCTTNRESEKLIRQYSYYWGFRNRQVDFLAISISNCSGLDNVNTEGSKASAENSSSKKKIGAAVATAGGAAAVAGIAPLSLLVSPITLTAAAGLAIGKNMKKKKDMRSKAESE